MNGLENFEPFDDLEDWLDNVELFMDAMAKPTEHADALWELAKLKKGLTPTQSWLQWMNENILRVEMGISLLAHPKHTY